MVEIFTLTRGVHAPRPYGQLDSCPILLFCRIALELEQKLPFFKDLIKLSSIGHLFNLFSGHVEQAGDSCRAEALHYNLKLMTMKE